MVDDSAGAVRRAPIPEMWWSPTMGAIQQFDDHFRVYGGGTGNYWGSFVQADFPADAVRLVAAPPTPRVFLANDQVPVGTVIIGKDGSPFRVPDCYASEGLARVGVPFVEVFAPSPEEWQAAVDQARAEREEADRG